MSLLQSKLLAYAVASIGLASAVVLNAYNTRGGFYAATVAISRSNGSVMVLLNFAVFLVLLYGILLKKVFFGSLRTLEIEHLYERSWYFLTETMLALTIFRDSFDIVFVAMFGLLLFLKCFHWISADRVDYMDQVPPPGPNRLFHARMASVLALLFMVNALALRYCVRDVIAMFSDHSRGGGATLLFASEFAVLLASNYAICAKYALNLIDLRRARGQADAPAWEDKSMYVFYVDLAYDAVRLGVYSTFFYLIFTLFGTLPLNQLHSLFSVIRSFGAKLRDLARYKTATRNMDQRYPDATTEEIERLGGGSCVICREEMVTGGNATQNAGTAGGPNETPKKLACGHVFHFHCLRSWLERQQSCPTCRRSVLETTRTTAAAAAPAQPGQVPISPVGGPATASTAHTAPANNGMHPTLNIWNNHFLHPATVAAYPQLRSLGNNRNPTYTPSRPISTPSSSAPAAGPTSAPDASPLPSVTPLSSQAPTVFSPISKGSDPGSSSAQPPIQETPAQMAAAAAMRRLQKVADLAGPASVDVAEQAEGSAAQHDIGMRSASLGSAPDANRIFHLRPVTKVGNDHSSVVPIQGPSDVRDPFLLVLDAHLSDLQRGGERGNQDEIQAEWDRLEKIEDAMDLVSEKIIVLKSMLLAGGD